MNWKVLLSCAAIYFALPTTASSLDTKVVIEGNNELKTAPLKTKKIYVKKKKGKEFHIATYKSSQKLRSKKKLTIKTCMADKYNRDVGVQEISLGNKVLSVSDRVHYQVINKTEFVVHVHENFKVYSSDNKQYVYFRE